jgi:hypothetical protein
MEIDELIKNRALPNEYIDSDESLLGLLRAIQYLFLDLSNLLEKENRKFGIVLSYLDSVYRTYEKTDFDDEIGEFSERIIYLIKPTIVRTFKKLRLKKLSEADAVIIIIKHLLQSIANAEEELSNVSSKFIYFKETNTLLKIINRLFNNIKNKFKTTNLSDIDNLLNDIVEKGYVGKYLANGFSIISEISKKKSKETLVGSGIRLNFDGDSKVCEIVWKND